MQPYSRNNFLPGPLMSNSYASRFPYGSAMPPLASRPNPLAVTQKVNTTPATAEGIAQAKQANCRPTKAESKMSKYKTDPAHHAQGEDAFKSLDAYMKRAGLNSFQTQFFTRLVQAGMPQPQIKMAIKQAGVMLGPDVSNELIQGFNKIAEGGWREWVYRNNPMNAISSGVESGVNSLGNFISDKFHGAAQSLFQDMGTGVARSPEVQDIIKTQIDDRLNRQEENLKSLIDEYKQLASDARPAIESVTAAGKGVTDASNTVNSLGQGISGFGGDMGGLFKQIMPYAMLSMLGAGGGGVLGGGGGATLGGIGLPLIYYLLSQQGGLGNLFGQQQTTNPEQQAAGQQQAAAQPQAAAKPQQPAAVTPPAPAPNPAPQQPAAVTPPAPAPNPTPQQPAAVTPPAPAQKPATPPPVATSSFKPQPAKMPVTQVAANQPKPMAYKPPTSGQLG